MNSSSSGQNVFHTLASDDVTKISLVEQCQFLECEFGTSLVTECLEHSENAHLVLQEAKATLVARDWELVLEMAKCHQSTRHISDPRIASSWCKLWDLALDHGVRGTRLIQTLLRTMSRPVFGKRECPICNCHIHEISHTLSTYALTIAEVMYISVEGVLQAIEGSDDRIFSIATTL